MARAIVVLFLVLLVPAKDAHAIEKIKISISGSYSMVFLSAGIAQKKGFFKDEELDAEIVVMRAATSIAALSSGDLDYTMLTGSVKALEGPVGEDVRRYYRGADLSAEECIRLFRLAWNLTGEVFGQRQAFYERYNTGDPVRLFARHYLTYGRLSECVSRIQRFLNAPPP